MHLFAFLLCLVGCAAGEHDQFYDDWAQGWEPSEEKVIGHDLIRELEETYRVPSWSEQRVKQGRWFHKHLT